MAKTRSALLVAMGLVLGAGGCASSGTAYNPPPRLDELRVEDRVQFLVAARLGQPKELYRGLRAEELAILVYIGTRVQALSAAIRPLQVTSAVRDDAYQDRLRSGNPEAAQGYSLHTTGFAFDVRRQYASGAQAQAFQFLLDDLTARNLIAWVREPAAIHVTVSSEADVLVPLVLEEG